MKRVKLMVKQIVRYHVEVEVEVSDDHDVEALSETFANVVREHSEELPDDAGYFLGEASEGVTVIDAPRWEQFKNDAHDWEMEYEGEYRVVEVAPGD